MKIYKKVSSPSLWGSLSLAATFWWALWKEEYWNCCEGHVRARALIVRNDISFGEHMSSTAQMRKTGARKEQMGSRWLEVCVLWQDHLSLPSSLHSFLRTNVDPTFWWVLIHHIYTQPRNPSKRWYPPQSLSLPHQSIFKMCHTLGDRPIWWKQFFNWGSLFPGNSSLCQVEKKKN